MFASFASHLAGPLASALFVRHSGISPVEKDLEALLARMRQRLYPETIPVLASYWLRTVCSGGHELGWWKELNRLLKRALGEQAPNDLSRQVIIEIQAWIQQKVLLPGQTPRYAPPRLTPVRAGLKSEQLVPYASRLLNEWLPMEVSRLLVDESEASVPEDGGIPAVAIGRALERLLVRGCLSQGTLEMLLRPELLFSEHVYPADAEILGDVVLYLLGRTEAVAPSVMPARLLCVAAGSHLPADYREAVRHGVLRPGPDGEEVHVPIAPAHAREILSGTQVRIGSIIMTRDGRWWESESLQSGEQHSVIYRPAGRLRIDNSADHGRLRVPLPDIRSHWPGSVHFRETFEIFGREWRVSQWEEDAERSWLQLAFSRALPIAEIAPAASTGLRRSRPASVDMAWAALENALTNSIAQKSREPIENLRHSDLIPLGRAILALTESVMSRRARKSDTIETQLRAIRYLEAQVSSVYGRVPWRILPTTDRAIFLKSRSHPGLLELLNQTFDELPGALSEATSQSRPADESARSTSPPHAA